MMIMKKMKMVVGCWKSLSPVSFPHNYDDDGDILRRDGEGRVRVMWVKVMLLMTMSGEEELSLRRRGGEKVVVVKHSSSLDHSKKTMR